MVGDSSLHFSLIFAGLVSHRCQYWGPWSSVIIADKVIKQQCKLDNDNNLKLSC